tara:strand:- start:261 stop:491 length:231 start_codon:yes stop_codon:yes gene_type:complete
MTVKKFHRLYTEIVNGECPHCEEYTMLVGITRQFYRCISCGADLEQYINGHIKYIPNLHQTSLKSVVDKYFDGQEI